MIGMICFGIPLADRFWGGFRRLIDRIKMPVFPLKAAGVPILAILIMVIPRLGLMGPRVNPSVMYRFDE